jgi:hypothetical protein
MINSVKIMEYQFVTALRYWDWLSKKGLYHWRVAEYSNGYIFLLFNSEAVGYAIEKHSREGYGFSIFTKVEGLPIPQTKIVRDVNKIVTLINETDYSPKGLELAQNIYKYACESERVYEDDSFWEDD